MTGCILAIDQGTTNTKAIAVDAEGRVVATASVSMQVDYPHRGWAEQSADAIWQAVQRVIAEIAGKVGPDTIAALAISNQRESIVLWEAATGRPIAPAVIWQCRRSAEICEDIRAAGHGDEIAERTGLALDPLFPAAKIAWLLDNVPNARARAERGELRAGTVDSWLIWQFTGGAVHATDHSNASRTQLFNTETLQWDKRLAEIFNVPLALMPQILPSDSHFGGVTASATALPAGVPIHAAIGDSHAALYGHDAREPGTVKATYGTGSSLMTLTPERITSRHGLSSTIGWSTSADIFYALEGNISVSGQSAAFTAELLGLADAAELSALAQTVTDSNGAVFVPALVGLGAPHWRDDARGVIAGLSLGTKPAHVARAAIEAIAFQVADVYRAMESDLGVALAELTVDGAASRNDFLMQFQADLLDRPVRRGNIAELSALGAARLAAVSLGWSAEWAESPTATFAPTIDTGAREALYGKWRTALARTLL